MFRAILLLALLVTLHGAPVAALDVGQRSGPVILNPGGTICDTVDDAIADIVFVDEGKGAHPRSCGTLLASAPATLEVVNHITTSKNTYAILRVVFFTEPLLGVQYGWSRESKQQKGNSI